MKLFIKQKVFSWKDRFNVKDSNDNTKYTIEGVFPSFGKKLKIYNSAKEELVFISQKPLSFKPRFEIFIGDAKIAEIVKDFTFFKQKYVIEGLQWEVEGNFLGHSYVIKEKGSTVATINKEIMTWGDSYILDISEMVNEVLALAVVITIDCVLSSSNSD